MRVPCLRFPGSLVLALLASSANGRDLKFSESDYKAPQNPYSPYVGDHFPRNVYFGDTYLHTAWSADAGTVGAMPGPEVADRAARGEVLDSQAAGPFKLIRPLDFVAVADHAENMGLSDYLERGNPLVRRMEGGQRCYQMVKAGDGYLESSLSTHNSHAKATALGPGCYSKDLARRYSRAAT